MYEPKDKSDDENKKGCCQADYTNGEKFAAYKIPSAKATDNILSDSLVGLFIGDEDDDHNTNKHFEKTRNISQVVPYVGKTVGTHSGQRYGAFFICFVSHVIQESLYPKEEKDYK